MKLQKETKQKNSCFQGFITSTRNTFKFYFLKSTKHLQAAPSTQDGWWTSACLEGRRTVWPVFSSHQVSELETQKRKV